MAMKPVVGTAEYPFLDLTPYLDLAGLELIKPDIFYGIVTARQAGPVIVAYTEDKNLSAYYHRWMVRSPENDRYFGKYEELIEEGLQNDVPEMRNRSAMAYASLVSGYYSSNISIPIRALGRPFKHDHIHLARANYKVLANQFESLLKWIDRQTLFREYGRVTIYLNPNGVSTPIHRDGDNPPTPHRQEFAWINLMNKRLFVVDKTPVTGQRRMAETDAVMFDHKTWHCTESYTNQASISLRIDGSFTDEIREELGLTQLKSYLTDDIYISE